MWIWVRRKAQGNWGPLVDLSGELLLQGLDDLVFLGGEGSHDREPHHRVHEEGAQYCPRRESEAEGGKSEE